MKAALILAVAGLAASQDLSGEPACATSCLSSAISRAGCQPNDQGCQCGPSQALIGSYAAPCLIAACTVASDLISAASVGSQLCVEYSATASVTSTGKSSGTGSMVITSTTTTSHSGSMTSTSTMTSTKNGTMTSSSSASKTTSSSHSGSGSSSSSSGGTSSTQPASVSHNLAAAATPVFIGALAAAMGVVAAL